MKPFMTSQAFSSLKSARNGGPFDLHLAFEGSNLSKCKLLRPGAVPVLFPLVFVSCI